MSDSVSQQISAMVAHSAAGLSANAPAINTVQNAGGMTVQVAHNKGAFEAGPVQSHGAPAAPGRISDSQGVDVAAESAAILGNVSKLQAQLDEVTYSPSGEPTFAVTGRARELLALQVQSARRSADYSLSRLEALQQQRQSDQHGTTRDARNLVTLASAGRPAFAKQLTDAIARQDAEEVAKAIRAQRDGK